MGRAGGWILGLVVVVGMAAAGALGLRPILFRKTLQVVFHSTEAWKGANEAGIQLAFEEKSFRAGRFKVQPQFITGGIWQHASGSLTIIQRGIFWSVLLPKDTSSDRPQLDLITHPHTLGTRAAVWARSAGITSVFIIDEIEMLSFTSGFRTQAASLAITCRSEVSPPQGKSLVESTLVAKPGLVILVRDDAAKIIASLRAAGYAGRFMVVDAEFPPAPPGPGEAALEGALIVTCCTPMPASLAGKLKTGDTNELHGYLMASALLKAVELADHGDPPEVYRLMSDGPEFLPTGHSALPGGLYVVKNGALLLMESLK